MYREVAATVLSCMVGSGLAERAGLPVWSNLTYTQHTPRNMQVLQKAGCEEFIFYTGRGTLLQNADGMVSVIHALT